MKNSDLLLSILKNPFQMTTLDAKGWNKILFEAHLLKLRGRLAYDAKQNDIWDGLPLKVCQILTNAEITAKAGQRKIMWELNRINRALFGFEDKVIVVKGGAYITQDLLCSMGRNSVDIDILVSKKNLDVVEDYLLKAGYESNILNKYDQHYYREWAHELPPLVHPIRKVEVDVHHNILQLTNKMSPHIDLMINSAVQIDGNLYVLSQVDMLLHSIVHLFVDGTIKASLRNLLEQHDLIIEFSKDPEFLPKLIDRAEELGFGRPLFYCLRYCQFFLQTPIPDNIIKAAEKFAPNKVILKLMDFMVLRTMQPYGQGRSKFSDYISTNGLYMRSHLLRMPPLMLMRHLMIKSLRRIGLLKS